MSWAPNNSDFELRLTAVPKPVSEIVSDGCAGSLVLMVTVAVRTPPAVGLNITLTAQFPPTATLVPQVFVCVKSPAFAPAIAIWLTPNGAVPELEGIAAMGVLAVFTI